MPLDKNIKYGSRNGRRPLILITNDDGVNSPGIKKLAKALSAVGDILVVAPLTEQSATSHAMTLHKPLRCNRISANWYALDGTPADCVNLAVNFILKGKGPDILFSGINHGPNLGDDINYSGTVSAAMEGGIFGIPSVAMSVVGPVADAFAGGGGRFTFDAAAPFAARLAKKILKNGLPRNVVLNVNVPNIPAGKVKGYRITFQGKKHYANITRENLDPRGEKYYWICGEESGFDDIPGSDCNAVADGYISILPLKVNPTDFAFLRQLKNWRI